MQHFVIRERLETGGMGEVYLGRDERNGRLAAIKTLSARLSKEEIYVRRFQREARLYRNLQHPNIVSCLESGFSDGIYYIAMEYIEGRSLARILEVYGQLAPEQALCVLAHLAEALEFAHRQYVIHRDIKPRNIMVTTDGIVKLLDFGVAYADDQLIKTDAGQMVGTFHYASPEQLMGGKVTARSDLYCLGLVYYEMLSGKRALENAHKGDPVQACHDLVPLEELAPDLDGSHKERCRRLLSFDAEERYPSARRLLRDIDEAERDPLILKPLVKVFGDRAKPGPGTLGTLATTVTSFFRTSFWGASRARRLALVAGVILWVVLLFVVYFYNGSPGS
jgi:serine/threonine-protein kinase